MFSKLLELLLVATGDWSIEKKLSLLASPSSSYEQKKPQERRTPAGE